MLKSKKSIYIFSLLFTFLELLLAVCVQTVGGRANDFLSVSAIALCFAFALLFLEKGTDTALIQAALFCTLMADICLIILQPRKQLLAMLFFSAVQICYFILLWKNQRKYKGFHLVFRGFISLTALFLTAAVLGEKADPLSLVSLFYFANLLLNVIFSFADFKKNRLFAVGLLLFLLCDICIGLSEMSAGYIPIKEGTLLYAVIHPGFNLAWLFYIPAQTLIALSLADKRLSKLK